MRLTRRIILIGLVLLCFTTAVLAQPDQCPEIVRAALEATDEVCSSIGRNQACYGNVTLEAEADEGADEFQFSAPGDVIDLANVLALRLAPLDEETEEWGVALMRIQANLPDTLPGQNVTFVLFGDVEIENAAPADSDDAVNPMQAFYFVSGLNDAPCPEAPDSGILIQTPEGGRTIDLTVNEVEITLGSTAYFQGQSEEDMTVSVLEGEATMTAEGETVVVPAGNQSTVPLDEDGTASGPPTEPEPYDPASLAALPVGLLDREIVLDPSAEATAQVGFGSGIQPVGGEWVSTSSVASAVGCPAGMAEVMAGVGGTPQSFTLPDGPFSLEQVLLSTDTAGMMTNGVYSSPAADTYVAEFDIEGSQISYEVRVISPTQMEGVTVVAFEGCTITIPFVATAVES